MYSQVATVKPQPPVFATSAEALATMRAIDDESDDERFEPATSSSKNGSRQPTVGSRQPISASRQPISASRQPAVGSSQPMQIRSQLADALANSNKQSLLPQTGSAETNVVKSRTSPSGSFGHNRDSQMTNGATNGSISAATNAKTSQLLRHPTHQQNRQNSQQPQTGINGTSHHMTNGYDSSHSHRLSSGSINRSSTQTNPTLRTNPHSQTNPPPAKPPRQLLEIKDYPPPRSSSPLNYRSSSPDVPVRESLISPVSASKPEATAKNYSKPETVAKTSVPAAKSLSIQPRVVRSEPFEPRIDKQDADMVSAAGGSNLDTGSDQRGGSSWLFRNKRTGRW